MSKAPPFPFKIKKHKQDVTKLLNLPVLTEAANTSTNILAALQRQMLGCYYCEHEGFEIVDPEYHDEEDPLDVMIQPLLQDVALDRRRSQALQSLYHLVDFQHKENRYVGLPNQRKTKNHHEVTSLTLDSLSSRVPLVCRRTDPPALKTVDVLASSCLMQDSPSSSGDRRWACLIINNLAIPLENKAAMVSNRTLMDALLFVISKNFPETHLCCVCLMNLSYTENADVPIHNVMLQYRMSSPSAVTPSTSDERVDEDDDDVPLSVILHNPNSLLRIIETMIKDYTEILIGNLAKTYSSRSLVSVQGEAVRWTVGWMRNVTVAYSGCLWLCQTRLPYDMIQVFHAEITATANSTRNSPTIGMMDSSPMLLSPVSAVASSVTSSSSPMASSPTGSSSSFVSKWTRDSLPDLALGVLLNLVQYSDCCEFLMERSAPLLKDALEPIVDQGGIHDMRASMILCRLEQHAPAPESKESSAWEMTKKFFQGSS